jgi:beta-RFAP synthase
MDSVTVAVPARLHLGFLDLNGSLGRKFGSIGLAIDGPQTRISLRRGKSQSVSGHETVRADSYLRRVRAALDIKESFALNVAEAIPSHAGLGSGTQLALAIAAGVRVLSALPLDPRRDAEILDRGARSGIGIALFTGGGIVLDGGRKFGGMPPPVVSQVRFPANWRIVLVFDHRINGMNGADETRAFAALPVFPESEAAHLCRLALMKAWPALIEEDIDEFGEAIAEMQRRLGDYFALAQGGRFTSSAVAEIAGKLGEAGAHGCGQSSWGPTGFAFAATLAEAERLASIVAPRANELGLSIQIVSGNNQGAVISPGEK